MASGGLLSPRVSYIIAELEDVDSVFAPIRNASRVKYTCFDVSRHYIVFGTTAGGIVILQHDSLLYIKTLTAKEGPVCQVVLAPDENIIGFATRGVALVMEHNAERGATQPQRLQLSYEHRGTLISCMHWNMSSSKLFIGDDKGKVSVINVSVSRTRNFFQVPTTTLMKLDSKVVQLDFAQDHLLVSTMTRCYLCDTNKEQYLTIGKKLRDGEYGACFYPGVRSVDPCTIYAARPGSRMWEVDIKGNVCCTHQFKTALAIKPEKLYTFRNEINMENGTDECKPQATNFQKLLLVWPSSEDCPFIFTWSQQGAFVFDLKKAEVVLWNEDLKGIKDARCQRGDIYIHFLDGRFGKYTLTTVEQGICRLYQQGLAIHGAQLLLLKKASLCSSRLNLHVPASFIIDMLQKTSEMGKSYLFSGLTSVLNNLGLSPDKLSQSSRSSSAMSEPVRLNSGIYVINKLMRDADDDAQSTVCLSRWRSASPVFRHGSRSPHSSPSRSSDRASYSSKSQRSSATVKDSSAKVRASSVIRTPDSTDSGTSGRVSEMSDETQSSPSSRDIHSKETWHSWNQLQSNQNENELKNAQDFNINGKSSLLSNANNALNNGKPKSDPVNGCLDHSNGDELNNNGSSMTPSISLNLQELSKHGNAGEKRVSFQSKVSTSSDESYSLPKITTDTVNGLDTNEDVFSPQYECPDSLYDEYRYAGMALYGSMMMMPNLDMSILFGTDADFQNIKESLANKLTSGKNIIMKNLRGLEQRILQDAKPDLLDVKTQHHENTQPTSPVSHSDAERSSSEFHSADRNFWSFLPAIDLMELIEITKNTWLLSRDLTVLCDKNSISRKLETWVNSLHSAQIAVIQSIISFLQNYHNTSSHSYKDDDTLRSTCSQITSQESSPSENYEISERLDQEDPSVSDSKSCDDEKHVDSLHSINAETSDSSTLRTESVLGKLVNLEELVFVYNPFRLSSDDHGMMSELAMMCFQMQIWGKIDKVMEMRSTILKTKEELLKSNDKKSHENLLCYSHEFSDLKNTIKRSESAHSFQKPELLACSSLPIQKSSYHNDLDKLIFIPNGDINTEEECSVPSSNDFSSQLYDDLQSSSFLQNYFHLFDVQRLRELLNVLNKPCYKTWNVMLAGVSLLSGSDEFTKKLAADQIETAANCLERSFIGPILISHLQKIFKASAARAIELCLQRSYHITSLDVLYLSKSCDTHPKPFLEYISRVVDCLPETQRSKVLDKLLHLDEVRLEWLYGVLQTENDIKNKLKCNCGWPRPGSHLYPWKHSQLILHILSTTTSMDNRLMDLCFSNGYWKGYILLAKKMKLNNVHRKLVIHLSDVNLLSANDHLGYLPANSEEWKEFFSLYSQSCCTNGFVTCLMCNKQHNTCTDFFLSSDDSKPWNTTLQWEAIARVALSHFDSIKVLEILQQLDIPNGAFTPGFHKAIVMTFLMEKQQSALMHRALTTVGSYLWSRKLQSLSPEARHTLQNEKEKPSTSDSQNSTNEDPPKAGHYYLEESEGHWGVATCLNTTCKICKLPLTSHLSASNGGITVYRCGHSYHTACSSEGFCMACLNSHTGDG
ncbi:Hermansky-Pudlak syndrome 5 protein-like isoform X2 [Stegodyphus dumicola]|uniref:Hermansky-Pudlak syndrome 5 protein-like isoform X2 n=1 Tax=Stegodyphus dumicola TaxID=202533 RepID=UPI0015AA26D5|nr:Hermansky-Pudlak syndrome 5 protein-like isoform X2 [Stegodyphus dumicola]